MSQQTPQERSVQPLPAWMLRDEEKTGGNAGAGGEETPSPTPTQEPEQTLSALPERKAVVPSPKQPIWSREEVQQSARGKDVLMRVAVGAILGAIIGGLVSYSAGGSPVFVAVCASLSAVLCGVIALTPPVALLRWLGEMLLEGLGEVLLGCLFEALLNCCSGLAVLVVASVVTIAGFLLWQSLLLAMLLGGSVIVMMLIGLSIVASSSYKARSQSSSSRTVSHDEQGAAVLASSLHGTGSQAWSPGRA